MRVLLIISALSLGFSILTKAAEVTSVHDGHTYVLVPLAKNWQMAKRDAESRGGYLVEISSLAEQRFIEQFIDQAMGRNQLPVWIGLTDEEGEGIWKWSNGKPLIFTNWQKNQPSNANGITPENYCVIWHSNAQSPAPNGRRNFYSVKVENYFWGRSAGFMLR